jgi:acetyl esterase/lipase
VNDSVFANGHTTKDIKESELSQYVNHDYLPLELRRSHQLPTVTYLNDTEGRFSKLSDILLSKDVSPLLVSDEFLQRNTPVNTYLLTTEIDILRDDGFIYAERLRKLGLKIEHSHYKNLFHGVFGLLHGLIEFEIAHKLLKTVVNHIHTVID